MRPFIPSDRTIDEILDIGDRIVMFEKQYRSGEWPEGSVKVCIPHNEFKITIEPSTNP